MCLTWGMTYLLIRVAVRDFIGAARYAGLGLGFVGVVVLLGVDLGSVPVDSRTWPLATG